MPICASRRPRSRSRATASAAAPPPSPCARASCWPISPSSSCIRRQGERPGHRQHQRDRAALHAARQDRELRGGPGRRGAVRLNGADRPLDALRRRRRRRADAGGGAAQAVGQGDAHHARGRPRRHGHQGPARGGKGQRPARLGAAGQGPDQSSSRSRPARSFATACCSTEMVQARSGATGIAATGRVDLVERTLDLHVAMKPSVPTDRPLKAADMAGAESVTMRGPVARAVRARPGGRRRRRR